MFCSRLLAREGLALATGDSSYVRPAPGIPPRLPAAGRTFLFMVRVAEDRRNRGVDGDAGGGGPKAVGGSARGAQEWVLAVSTKYLFYLQNIGANANQHHINLSWYEHTNP